MLSQSTGTTRVQNSWSLQVSASSSRPTVSTTAVLQGFLNLHVSHLLLTGSGATRADL